MRSCNTSVVRFADLMIYLSGDPSTKVLGYFRIVRFADGNRFYFLGKSSWNIHREENQTRDPQS